MIKSNEEIIKDLYKNIERLTKLISAKDGIIKNYEVLVSTYKNMLKDEEIKKSEKIAIFEKEIDNMNALITPLMVYQKQNFKSHEEIKKIRDSIDYKKRLN